jgi:hypothetical protein
VKTLHTDVEIAAPAARVWAILADLPAYPAWNPFIRRIAGELAPGARLEVRLEPPGGMGITLRPTVLAVDAARELRWLGHLLVRGLFDGEHRLALEPLGAGRVRFVQEERFSGLLVPLLAKSLDTHTLPGFEAMNRALKARAEAAGPAPAAPAAAAGVGVVPGVPAAPAAGQPLRPAAG